MTGDFTPTLYLKDTCPFCLKIRIFPLEAGLADTVTIRDFVAGTPQEDVIRTELAPHLETVSFPAAEIESGRCIADSDEIIAFPARCACRVPSDLTVYRNYVEGPLPTMMSLFRENRDLKAAGATSV